MPNEIRTSIHGYFAYDVAHSTIAKTDPFAWKIVDKKRYSNDEKHIKKWEDNQESFIKAANQKWTKILADR